ncbi:MFS transporter, partial [Candidatus Bipolaricaulota bacterium]|nr:MFS transporter [Candidatus Bipolaricaulota bacterium]
AFFVLGLMALIPITRSINNITMNPILAHSESQDERGFVFGVRDVFLHSGAALGTFAGGWFLAASYSGNSFRNIYLTGLSFLFFTGVIVYFIKGRTKNSTGDEFGEGLLKSFKEINEKKSLFTLSMLQVFRGFYPPLIAFIPILGAEIGLKNSHIMYVIASSTGVTAVLSLAGGKLSDLFNRKKMYLTDIFFDLLILSALFFAQNIYIFSLGLGLMAINSTFYANINAYIYDLFEESQASRAVSILSSTEKMIGVFAPAIIGFLWGINRNIAISLGILGSGAAFLLGKYLLPESEKDLDPH